MKLGFFQEFTSLEDFSVLSSINFPINLYIGCQNVRQFLKLNQELRIKYKHLEEIVYWPILKLSEGYWLSGFTKQSALQRIIKEINSTKKAFPVLWDTEFPMLNKKLFLTGISSLPRNLILIYRTLLNQRTNHPLIVAEFTRTGLNKILSTLGGTSFPFTSYNRLDMLYSSMFKTRDKEARLRKVIRSHKRKYKKYYVGLGLIGKDKNDKTPLLSENDLNHDMKICKEERIKEVVLYRLNGLNHSYLKIIKKYI